MALNEIIIIIIITICASANNIQIDTDGEIDVTSRGYPPGRGTGAGVEASGLSADETGGSGGSHGGLGGRGSQANYANPAYDSVLIPRHFGSGGNTLSRYNANFNRQVSEHAILYKVKTGKINITFLVLTINVFAILEQNMCYACGSDNCLRCCTGAYFYQYRIHNYAPDQHI